MNNLIKLVVLLLIGVLGLSYFQPNSYQIRRVLVMEAPSPVIFALISDLRSWEKWSPWFEKDTDMKISYSPATTDVGGYAEWDSASEGKGRQTISDLDLNRSLKLDLEFIKPFSGEAKAHFFIEKLPSGGTEVVWILYGRNETVLDKFFYLVMNLDKKIGLDYEKGLINLKNLAESQAAK